MKNIILTFILATLYLSSFAQTKFKEGYIIEQSGTTKLLSIYIPNNGKIKTRQKGNVIKYSRTSLKDYGFIENGKQKSMFAATAFPVETYEGYYISKSDGDTIHGYFIKWSSKEILIYKKSNLKKTIINENLISSYSISDEIETFAQYERINYRVTIDEKEYSEAQLCRVLQKGKITLYRGEIYEESEVYLGDNTGSYTTIYPIYVLKKDNEIIGINSKTEIFEENLFSTFIDLFQDYPELIKGKTFKTVKKSEIVKMVILYNEFFNEK